jgi:uncharacterized protein YbjT (DUF2867 family)
MLLRSDPSTPIFSDPPNSLLNQNHNIPPLSQTSKMPTYLISLATGQQGRYTVKHLLQQQPNTQIHAVVRNPSSASAQALRALGPESITLFQGSLDDESVWRKAATGTTGLFLNLPDPELPHGSAETTHTLASTILRAAQDAGVRHVVASSVLFCYSAPEKWDGEATRSVGLHALFLAKKRLEDAVFAAGMTHTVLRLPWLNANYLLPASREMYPGLAERGELAHALAEGKKMAHVDEEDVGRYAAAALMEPGRFAGKKIDLVKEDLSMEDVAGVLGMVSGRDVVARRRGDEEVKGLMEKGEGMPGSLPFELWANAIDFRTDEGVTAEEFGIELTGFEEYARKHAREIFAEEKGQE